MNQGQEYYNFPSGSTYPADDQQPMIIHSPLAGPSHAHYHNTFDSSHVHVAAQNNLYMRPGLRNQMATEEPAERHPVAPFPEHPIYYPSVPPHPRHVTNTSRTHSVRVRPYPPNHSSSSRPSITRRGNPPTPDVVFNFPCGVLVEDPMIAAPSISAGPVPSNEPWTHLSIPQSTASRCPRRPSTPSTSGSSVDCAATFVQSAFPIGTPDYASKQMDMYTILTSSWKQNNEFEPNPEVLLRFATNVDGFWKCAFYVDGRRCERSMTERTRQTIEHIRRHIKLEPYECEGQPCPTSTNGCGKRYSSGDPLRKHRDGNLKGESICDLCRKTLLPGNIIRHRKRSCRETGH